MSRAWVLAVVLIVFLSGCAHIPSPDERSLQARQWAERAGWSSLVVPVPGFKLQAYAPKNRANGVWVVFLEGDGFAWVNRSTPSQDPTPMQPVALQMALAHPEGRAVYLARPCQYLRASSPACRQRLWTQERFSAEVVQALDRALDHLKGQLGAERWILVGFSGGGALATLLAAQRQDVVGLVTVAGNLDPDAWARWHGITPLRGSLNPAHVAAGLRDLPQLHVLGAKDQEVPPALAQAWPAALQGPGRAHIWIEPGADHLCCWATAWPSIWHRFKSRSMPPPHHPPR